MRAAFEFSSRAEGGTRSLKGCRMSGGNSHTLSPRVVIGSSDIFLRFSYRQAPSELEALLTILPLGITEVVSKDLIVTSRLYGLN
jgi:hypothetical protein